MPRPGIAEFGSSLLASPLYWVESFNAICGPTAKKHKSLPFQCVTRSFKGTPNWKCKPFAAVALLFSANRKNLQRVSQNFHH
jgi:hypothetical protein